MWGNCSLTALASSLAHAGSSDSRPELRHFNGDRPSDRGHFLLANAHAQVRAGTALAHGTFKGDKGTHLRIMTSIGQTALVAISNQLANAHVGATEQIGTQKQ